MAIQPHARRGLFSAIQDWLPEGRGLPYEQWRIRHRGVLIFIHAHAVGLTIFGLVQGWGPGWAIGEGVLIAGLGGIAGVPQLSRPMRGAVAALAWRFAP